MSNDPGAGDIPNAAACATIADKTRLVQRIFDQRLVGARRAANYERLVALKTKYDPDNLFHLNFNISPGATVV